MAALIPTEVGDVLVLRTERTFHIHAVGVVSQKGQQGFQGQPNVKHVHGHAAAVAEAKALRRPGRRIFLRDIDTDEWSEISD